MTFTLEQAMRAQGALREAAQLPAEQFPLRAFIGMLSDEIEAARKSGKTDRAIMNLINDAAGVHLTEEMITENYATPEERGKA